MEAINVSMDLQINVMCKRNMVIAYSKKHNRVIALYCPCRKEIYVFELDKNGDLIKSVTECELITDLENPDFFRVGTGACNITNIKKAYALIRKGAN